MLVDKFNVSIALKLQSNESSNTKASMPVKLVIPKPETLMAPLNTLASETWISLSILVLILVSPTNAALKIAFGIFTFWACELAIQLRIVIPIRNIFFTFIILFLVMNRSLQKTKLSRLKNIKL